PDFTDDTLHPVQSIAHAQRIKTPSLRNCAMTAPYMHDGSSPALQQALMAHGPLGLHITELNQSELKALCSFLETLTDSTWQELATPPAELPSGIVSN